MNFLGSFVGQVVGDATAGVFYLLAGFAILGTMYYAILGTMYYAIRVAVWVLGAFAH